VLTHIENILRSVDSTLLPAGLPHRLRYDPRKRSQNVILIVCSSNNLEIPKINKTRIFTFYRLQQIVGI